jgi:hypothetical protein
VVRRILSAGLEIKGREAKLLGVVFGCSKSAIQADVKVISKEGESGSRSKTSFSNLEPERLTTEALQ